VYHGAQSPYRNACPCPDMIHEHICRRRVEICTRDERAWVRFSIFFHRMGLTTQFRRYGWGKNNEKAATGMRQQRVPAYLANDLHYLLSRSSRTKAICYHANELHFSVLHRNFVVEKCSKRSTNSEKQLDCA